MSVPVPFRLTLPTAAEMGISRPVVGVTLGKLAGAANCLAGYRGRGWHTYIPTIRRDVSLIDSGFPWGLADRTEEHNVWIRTSPLTRRLELVAAVAAQDSGGTTAPYLRVSLHDAAGATLDVGVQWAREDGTLDGLEVPRLRLIDGTKCRRGRPYLVETGGTIADYLASGATWSSPRMLILDGHGGERVRLHVTSTGVQLLSLTTIEAVEATL